MEEGAEGKVGSESEGIAESHGKEDWQAGRLGVRKEGKRFRSSALMPLVADRRPK